MVRPKLHSIRKMTEARFRLFLRKTVLITFYLCSLGMMILLPACEDPYWPELGNKYEDLLVVEGRITSQPGPYTVKLSRSTTLLYPKYFPLEGFEVIIEDNAGNSETLAETAPGVYQTAPDGIQGVVGRSYRLRLNGPTGKSYASDFEVMPQPVAIDTLYTSIEYAPSENFVSDIPGYQFYINTRPAAQDSTYFRWRLEETYEYNADFKIYQYYDGNLHVFPNPDSLYTCWKTEPVYEIFTTTTAGLSDPVISDFPLHYVSFEQREFSVRYSLLIEQLTLPEKTYKFWKAVADQNNEGGGLYNTLPYQISGNIHNLNDETESVPGYFEVAGLDVKRIFINRPEPPMQMYYPVCVLTQADYEEYGFMFRTRDWREWPKYVVVDINGTRAVPPKQCSDCRERGGTLTKPEFWIEQ